MLTAAAAALWLSGCAIKPTPFTVAQLQQTVQDDRSAMFSRQQPVTGPITLDEAMARAIRYNLDHRLKMMEEVLGQKQLDLSNFDLLPKLTAQAGYTDRNHPLSSSSTSTFNPGVTTVPQSYSTDQSDRTADLGFSWNLLDLGVSYYEAKEQADRVLVLEQRRRKVVQLMMQQVREAYWQAAGAQRLHDRIEPLLIQARAALNDSKQAQQEQLRAPLDTLNYQHELLDLMRQLEIVRDQLDEAKPRLASLMNLEPGKDFVLAPPDGTDGHHLYGHVAAWSEDVQAFLKEKNLLPLGDTVLPAPEPPNVPMPAGLQEKDEEMWRRFLLAAPFKTLVVDEKGKLSMDTAGFDQSLADNTAKDRCKKGGGTTCTLVAKTPGLK